MTAFDRWINDAKLPSEVNDERLRRYLKTSWNAALAEAVAVCTAGVNMTASRKHGLNFAKEIKSRQEKI